MGGGQEWKQRGQAEDLSTGQQRGRGLSLVAGEWRGVHSAQILNMEPVGFLGVMALGWKDRREVQGFYSEQLGSWSCRFLRHRDDAAEQVWGENQEFGFTVLRSRCKLIHAVIAW